MTKKRKQIKTQRGPVSGFSGYLAFRELPFGAEGFLSAEEVKERIFGRTRKHFARITVYQMLKRGEYNGQCWATWRLKEEDRKKGNRRERVFSLTAKGKKFVEDLAKTLAL